MLVSISIRQLATLFIFLPYVAVIADPGDPIALRRWPGGVISVETMWNLNVVVDLYGGAGDKLKAAADYVQDAETFSQHTLLRAPNSPTVARVSPSPASQQKRPVEANQVRVNTWRIAERGKLVRAAEEDGFVSEVLDGETPTARAVEIVADGVTFLIINADQLPQDVELESKFHNKSTVLVLSFTDATVLTHSNLGPFVKAISPRLVVLNPTAATTVDLAMLQDSLGTKREPMQSSSNTLAISEASKPEGGIQIVELADQPQPMPDELAALFALMETSCEKSQKVFEKLSVDQMNWKPSNGTHTPRWNTEHMMGRQLLFFSQIYNAVDPAIPVMDLNPKQMPEDYQYAHADWTGAEEARQMERVSRFTRRFAYLIHDLDVNRRAPGSRWPSLKALLLQMERHYSEHTANTVKKFNLPDWPGEE